MLNTRLEVARSVGLPLLKMEEHLDQALVQAAAMQSAAIDGRRKAKLPLEAGEDALTLVADATAQLLAARKAVHQAHRLLRQEQTAMGLKTVAYGDYGDTPEGYAPASAQATPALSVVQAA